VYLPAVLMHSLSCSNTSHLFQLHDMSWRRRIRHIFYTRSIPSKHPRGVESQWWYLRRE